MADSDSTDRIVRHLSIAYFTPTLSADGNKSVLVRTARRGESIDASKLAEGELDRLEELHALLPAGSKPQDVEEEREAILDVYRGQRGDVEALSRAMERARVQGPAVAAPAGGIVDVSGGDAGLGQQPNVGSLADHITVNKLTVDDTVALANDDAAAARRVLEAERLASGGSPRAGVEQGLQKIIDR